MEPTENQGQEMTKAEIKEAIFAKKEALAVAKSAFKKFRKSYGIRDIEKVKEEKTKAEYLEHEARVAGIQAEIDALTAKEESTKGGTRGSYVYGEVNDPETGTPRKATKAEMKRWRAKSRKTAKAEGIKPQDIPWDANFLVKPVKEEKPKKEKKEKAEKAEEAVADLQKAPKTKGENPADAAPATEVPKKKKAVKDLD